MPDIRLPDGSVRAYANPLSGQELAEDIGKRLAKSAVAIRVDGRLRDLSTVLAVDCEAAVVTREEPEGLELLRHDAAHVMAEAIKELYPAAQITIGPAIEHGFYYDVSREEPFHPEDLEALEARMREIVDRDETIEREIWDRDAAIRFFRDQGELYKAEIIEDLPSDEVISLYRQGQFVDLCRGPHLPSTGRLGKAFKLLRVSGAYWRGDSNNEMLQRIYGTAWSTEKELRAYLHQLEEAERRDHRRLAREMDLFHFQEEGPGCVFWHEKGWRLFQRLIDYMRGRQEAAGYLEVNTPEVLARSLWEASGHWEKFGENMFTTETPDNRVFALKPMNCPGHVQVFNQGIKSYRELPLRMAEFGKVHRFEPSGALHGLMRVRGFTQDDAHIFCTEEQITDECVELTNLILSIYRDFGFHDIAIKFADRPDKRVGADEVWDKSEAALRIAVEATGLPYTLNPGEGAFYGPKLEFVLRDAIGRDWQCGTVQVDLNLPDRLGASYVDEQGTKKAPVMIHRALFGSLERFTGILLEHYAGRLPLWLSPLQAVVATIVSDADGYASEVASSLRAAGLIVDTDLRNEKISYKVREHSHAKIPAMVIVGQREADQRSVSVRRIGSKQQQSFSLEEAVGLLAEEAKMPTLERAPERKEDRQAATA